MNPDETLDTPGKERLPDGGPSEQEIRDSSDGRDAGTERDAGAYIGHEPELAAERIPGGVRPQDHRVAATQSEPAAPGEPESDTSGSAEVR